ncbi:MAG TPA: LytR C-terminal domain-containing protein [Jatrophihabitantaceae bacterium]|nr:LytR C-terminal domain-containing protein [Jatrophihabitantaceae bacterium]
MLAVLGLIVLAVAVAAIRHPDGRSANAGVITQRSPTATAPATTTPTRTVTDSVSPVTTSARPAPGKLPLVVLNNTTVHGLAQQARQTFETGGWAVTGTGNLTNDIASTCAYYDPNVSGAHAAALALQQQFPAIKRVQPKFAELPAGPIVVVLTPDYTTG